MEKLTAKEEEVLGFFWKHGALHVKDIVDMYDDPKPHFNTISTIVRALEDKGYVGHTQQGKTYLYHAAIAEQEMGKKSIGNLVSRYFKNSYLKVVSSFVEDGNLPIEDLRKLLNEVEQSHKTEQ
ncbi:BlaI/MecI/CopY family transcriptional regulator [Lepagella muris]|jgi:predicted transcriptional regulator|uniref:BlaI/MecI/CopY family transcriptional regulator n=1 Tax=Lepagella muris TaxID=3032870 RepID=A0AC61RK19_9BACT|nr:BlaI/MecI/CopY family transcriptional regulator [Lepagella muris]ROT02966.1 BlaI/MecI/CopY family transcriptional regulator [Muribaculaceae bacterium Isolate-037 (Harlan)]TGY80285.1 BlaI/MecI/CopY family transcriptional regulator [Lepagella muris]THG52824.1 BlaI/MecI/CopY family transcriptional regulator [Bacteroidales bacterium]TKC58726.1 BlaI/MecI/CopY family transcriptional regulator [Bacteroidales bacterium]